MLERLVFKSIKKCWGSFRQEFSTNAKTNLIQYRRLKMAGWQIHEYGKLDELQYSENVKVPKIKSTVDCLVKVNAAGVNPIDVAMVGGYGSNVLNIMRCGRSNIEFPLTLGREFSGIVVQKGMGLCSNIRVGDSVWGVVPLYLNGSHAEYVVVPEYCISKKPKNFDELSAASTLYAGLTAWSALYITGNLGGVCGTLTASGGGKGKRVLVLGASGGVGSMAVQILKAEGVTVFATCSTNAIPVVQNLNPDYIVDYTNQKELQQLNLYGPFDIVLDCAGLGPKYPENFNWSFKSYITLSSPLLSNIDKSGFQIGMAKNFADLIETNVKTIVTKQGCVKWGYFVPAPQGIQYLHKLAERKKIMPVIDEVYNFNDTNEAYKKVENGHLRGKVVLNTC